jgi:polyferredoxin
MDINDMIVPVVRLRLDWGQEVIASMYQVVLWGQVVSVDRESMTSLGRIVCVYRCRCNAFPNLMWKRFTLVRRRSIKWVIERDVDETGRMIVRALDQPKLVE